MLIDIRPPAYALTVRDAVLSVAARLALSVTLCGLLAIAQSHAAALPMIPQDRPDGFAVLVATLVGPAMENLLLSVALAVPLFMGCSRWVSVAIGTVALAALHALFSWQWAVTVLPLFAILGETLTSPGRFLGRQGKALAIHGLQNAIAFGLINIIE
jgi:hypothetical protein